MTKEERHELYKTILREHWNEERESFPDGLCRLIAREIDCPYINEEYFPELLAVKPPGIISGYVYWWKDDFDRKAALEKMIELSKPKKGETK